MKVGLPTNSWSVNMVRFDGFKDFCLTENLKIGMNYCAHRSDMGKECAGPPG